MNDEETLGVYAREAETYDTRFSEKGIDPDQQAFIEAVRPGGRILDLGCGPGRSAAIFADAGFSVLAVDAVAEMVALAARHPAVEARQATFEDIPELGEFDVLLEYPRRRRKELRAQ